jgi:hypothetical protein
MACECELNESWLGLLSLLAVVIVEFLQLYILFPFC